MGALSLFLLLGYQNCGSDFAMQEGLDLGSVTEQGLNCELNAFKTTYYGFLGKCKACHVPGGTGSGAFSSSNPQVAYDAFLLATTTKIDERSVNQNHAPGITGPVNQATIDGLRPQFDNALATCSQSPNPGGTPVPVAVLSAEKAINAAQTTQTLTWNLASEVSGTSVTGATFTIIVQSATTPGGTILYTISQPRITTTGRGVRIGQMMFKFNGNDLPLVTTYSRLDQTIAVNQTNISLSNAAAAFEAPATPSRIAISFGLLEPQ